MHEHLSNSNPEDNLVDVILQDKIGSRVDNCTVQDTIISKQSDLGVDVAGNVVYVQEEEERSENRVLWNIRCYRKPGGLRTTGYHALFAIHQD